MGFKIQSRSATAGQTAVTIFCVSNTEQTLQAEVWPMFGFNCLRWAVKRGNTWGDVLYTAPDWETNPVPTRSGHPILFPFPNRLRAGRFTFEGKTYQLPRNESTGQHAIHGFTPKTAWRMVGNESGKHFASITGEFQLSLDAPGLLEYWPSDFCLAITYRFEPNRLSVVAHLRNLGKSRMPFGLGYHPYFRLPSAPTLPVNDYELHMPATKLWLAEQSLATGEHMPPPEDLDFRTPRKLGTTEYDHLYGGFKPLGRTLAILSHPQAKDQIRIEADRVFREVLLFTPPHRQAVALEPYTCTTDALNLASQGIDSGLRILEPSQEFSAEVHYSLEPYQR